MNKIVFAIFCCLIYSGSVISQQVIFQKTYGDSLFEEGLDLKKTFDGGYILTGSSNSSHPSNFNPDLYLVKTDSVGNIEWKQTFSTTVYARGQSVIQTSDSGFFVLGTAVQPFRVNNDFYYLKTDVNGNLLLADYAGADFEYEYANQILQTNDGGFIMTGQTEAGLGGNVDFFVLKFDQNLNNQFANAYGDSTTEGVTGITQTNDNAFVFVGSSVGNPVHTVVVKLDTSGNIIWSKSYSGVNNNIVPVGIKQTADNGFVIAGTISFGAGGYDCYLLKIDSIGNIIWSKTYGDSGTEYSTSFAQKANGNFILTGVTTSFGFSNEVAYVFETDNAGNLLWSKVISSLQILNSIVTNSDGSFAIAGTSDSTGVGHVDILLIKADSTGNFGCNQTNVSTISNTVVTTVDTVNLIISSGGNIGTAIANIVSIGISNTICSGVGIDEANTENLDLNIFPNPSDGNFSLDYYLIKQKEITISLFDVTGNLLTTFYIKATAGLNKISFTRNNLNLLPGIYFVRLTDGSFSETKKLMLLD